MSSTTWNNQIHSGTLSGTTFGQNQLNDEWNDLVFDQDDDEDNDGGQYAHGNYSTYKNPYQNPYSTRDCIVFLIDSSKSMFEKNENGEIPFNNSVKCLISTITAKITNSESDLIGICFYNTDKKKNINDFENIYVLSELDIPDPKVILQLEEILENDNFTKMLGHSDGDSQLSDSLWTCSTMFSNMKQSGPGSSSTASQQNNSKRIFLFTNEDNPYPYNESNKNNCIQRAKDLSELGITIELFSLNKSNEKFDFTVFYQDILVFGDADDQYIDPNQFNATTKFSELESRLKRKQFKKRSLGKIPLYIGKTNSNDNGDGQIIISTQLYNLFSSAKKSSPVLLDPKTNLPVKQLIKNVCESTGSVLLPSQIKQSFFYGGEPVIFSKDELDSIKSIDRIGLTLLGFKPISAIKPYHSIKHSSFIFPDENLIKGSTVAFNALVEQMLKSEKVAICRFTSRSGSAPRMVALLAQDEILINEFDQFINPLSSSQQHQSSSQQSLSQQSLSQQNNNNNNNLRGKIQFRPRGMHIIYLPYADDIRHPINVGIVKKKPEEQEKEQESIEMAKKVIKSMKFKFDEKKYLNPSLQKHYASLQALALERDTIEDTIDNIQPDKQLIEKSLDICKEFSDSIFPQGYAQSSSASSSASSNKRSRDSGKDLSQLNWSDIVKSGEISKLTVDELKSFLNNQNCKFSSKSKKADLITIISKHIIDGNLNNQKLLLLKKDPSIDFDDNSNNNNDSSTNKNNKDKNKNKNKDNEDDDGDDGEDNRPKKKLRSKSPAKSNTKDKDKDLSDNDEITDDDDDHYENKKRKKSSKNSTTTITTSKSNNKNNNDNNNNKDDQFDIDFKNSDDDDNTDNEIISSAPNTSTNNASTSSQASSINNNANKKSNYRSDNTFDTRKLCQYDPNCYRTNPQHNLEYRHTNK